MAKHCHIIYTICSIYDVWKGSEYTSGCNNLFFPLAIINISKLPTLMHHATSFFFFANSNNPENIINSKYCDINRFQALKDFTNKSSLSLFHLHTALFESKKKGNFKHLIDFDIIALPVSRLIRDTNTHQLIQLNKL